MKGTRPSEKQIIAILKPGDCRVDDGGVMPTARDHGADYYCWPGYAISQRKGNALKSASDG
jgi:hypothetical protein